MKGDGSEGPTPERVRELERIANVPEEAIDARDMPEQRDWSDAKRGLFFRPIKQLTLRLDAWFKARAPEGKGHQTGISSALRAYVEQHGQD